MTSTYSTSLRLNLMATGDQPGTWGDTTNTNLGTLLEQAITGVLSVAEGDTTLTLSTVNGGSDQARNAVVNLTGAMTGAQNVVVPTANKLYLIKNSTTGGFAVTVKTSGGTGVAVPATTARWVYCDGTNVVDALSGPWTPPTNDAAALGLAAVSWSDLFLASGGVINWNNGNMTLTHSAGVLTFAGGALAISGTSAGPASISLAEDTDNGTNTATLSAKSLIGSNVTAYIGGKTGDLFTSAGYLYGTTLSNNVTDATNDIDIAAGEATDSTGAELLVLGSALTKRTDAAWAVGTGNGGWLDGSSMPDGTGHAFLIKRSDTGVVDVGFSASLTPTLPSGYDYKRRVGSIIRSSGAILPFVQNGDEFQLKTAVLAFSATTSATAALKTQMVPVGIKVIARIRMALNCTGTVFYLVSDPACTDEDPSTASFDLAVTSGGGRAAGDIDRRTNTSAQLRHRANGTDGSATCWTYGWFDSRDRL